MIRNIFISLILLISSISTFAQSISYDWHNMIGFACGAKGRPTVSIMNVGSLIMHRNFDSIKTSMHSPIPSIKYLSVKTGEFLEQKGMIQFSAEERTYMNEIKKSGDTLYYCSGCTEKAFYTLRELFGDKSITLNKGVDNWINSCLKIKIPPDKAR